MADSASVVLRMLLDKSKSQEVVTGIKGAEKAIDDFEKKSVQSSKKIAAVNDALSQDFVGFTNAFNDRFKVVDGKLVDLQTGVKTTAQGLREFTKIDLGKLEESTENVAKEMEKVAEKEKRIREESEKIRREKTERMALEKAIRKEIELQRKEIEQIRDLSRSVGGTGRALFLGGTAILGGLFASAQSEANRQKQADTITPLTQRWLDANKRIELSMHRIGRVAERAIIPFLEQAAALSERVSKFIERHPESLEAAAKAGALLVGLGAVTTAASRGIRMVADIKEMALRSAEIAALEKNTAALLGSKALGLGGIGAGAAGTIGVVGGSVAIMAAGSAGLAAMLNKLEERLVQVTGKTHLVAQAMTILTTSLPIIGPMTQAFRNMFRMWPKWTKDIEKLTSALFGASEGLEDLRSNAEDEAQGMKILRNLEKENLAAENKYVADRAKILEQAANALANANARLASQLSQARSSYQSTIIKARAEFLRESAEAERKYEEEKARIISDGAEAIRRIEEQKQEELRRLEEEHLQRRADAIDARDALALYREDERFEKEQGEIERRADKAISEQKKETQKRLQEQAQAYAQERAQRQAQYAQQVAEAKARYAQEVAEARAQHEQETREIARNKAQQLNELQKAYNEEKRQRIEAAYEQIKDLGGALKAEQALWMQYYNWLHSATSRLLSASVSGGAGSTSRSAPTRTAPAINASASIISNRATAAAPAFSSQGGAVTWNDHRRFDSRVTAEERMAITDDTAQLLREALGG